MRIRDVSDVNHCTFRHVRHMHTTVIFALRVPQKGKSRGYQVAGRSDYRPCDGWCSGGVGSGSGWGGDGFVGEWWRVLRVCEQVDAVYAFGRGDDHV
ncbi:hypothetical protein Mam01_31700 [Microbispora amethystogenes]|uniref:Uncharacterized protein n=1 Tax=Microbispora amethystogenes TaxID=1427754 RepID=A0ABQ4FDY6_9ACTN|nr:hypothetical protein Mam01_31700 [Microbispora amethystogenes]